MATLKEEQQSIFGILGVANMAEATAVLANWQNAAALADTFAAQQKEYFAALGCTDHAGAIEAISKAMGDSNTFGANLGAIWVALGNAENPVADQISALAAIAKFKGDNAHLQTQLATAQKAVTDFDTRLEAGINKGVIDRAAAAGLPAAVEKPKTSSTGEAPLTEGLKGIDRVRAAFEAKQPISTQK